MLDWLNASAGASNASILALVFGFACLVMAVGGMAYRWGLEDGEWNLRMRDLDAMLRQQERDR